MDYTPEQLKTESIKFPVVVKVDGMHVPVDVPTLLTAIAHSGVRVRSFTMWYFDTGGVRLLVLSGIAWEAFIQPNQLQCLSEHSEKKSL